MIKISDLRLNCANFHRLITQMKNYNLSKTTFTKCVPFSRDAIMTCYLRLSTLERQKKHVFGPLFRNQVCYNEQKWNQKKRNQEILKRIHNSCDSTDFCVLPAKRVMNSSKWWKQIWLICCHWRRLLLECLEVRILPRTKTLHYGNSFWAPFHEICQYLSLLSTHPTSYWNSTRGSAVIYI